MGGDMEKFTMGNGKYNTEGQVNVIELGTLDSPEALVVGTTQLFRDGQRRYIPMPTPDPRDPLNLPSWRKWSAVAALCLFGALALSAEFVIAALVPVFVLEYSGIDPKILGEVNLSSFSPPGQVNVNPVKALAGLGGPPIWEVALLASLPLLVNGTASYALVPLSIAVGRRPVIVLAALFAWAGGLWAGFSQSLGGHLAARTFQGIGAGAVEALIPLIVQDIMFIHQRNKAMASIGASQGLVIVGLGVCSPILVVRLSWRYIYWITSAAGFVAWVLVILFVPETRWIRTPDELAGKEVYPLRPGETRPRLDVRTFGPRTDRSDFGMFHVSREWARARQSVWETVRTTVFPNVLWVMLVHSICVAIHAAAAQVGSSVLIAAGWRFEQLGLMVLPVVAATPFVWFMGGYVADRVSNAHARRRGGRREPEAHLISLVIPLASGIAGPVLFGYAGQNADTLPPFVLFVSIFLIAFGSMTANTLFNVYLVESYPAYAGPVLVNVTSFRLIVGFGLSFKVTEWVERLGFLESFSIYGGALAIACLGLPLVYFDGKRIRRWAAGQLEPTATPEMAAVPETVASLENKSADSGGGPQLLVIGMAY